MSGFVEEIVGPIKKVWKESKRFEGTVLGKVGKEKRRTEAGVEKTVKAPFTMPPFPEPTTIKESPAPTTVLASTRADSIADKLKKRKRYKTAMSRGYGELSLSQAGLLGVS